jgi:hypothetical protein
VFLGVIHYGVPNMLKTVVSLWAGIQESDRGQYKCRVDFKQAPARSTKVFLEVVGKSLDGY